VVIAAVTVAATDAAAATMIVVMIVPLSLPLLETNRASLTQGAVEIIAAARIATQVGRLVCHVGVRSNGEAVDNFFGIPTNNCGRVRQVLSVHHLDCFI